MQKITAKITSAAASFSCTILDFAAITDGYNVGNYTINRSRNVAGPPVGAPIEWERRSCRLKERVETVEPPEPLEKEVSNVWESCSETSSAFYAGLRKLYNHFNVNSPEEISM